MATNKASVDRDAWLTMVVYSDSGGHCLLTLCIGVTTAQVLDFPPTFSLDIIDLLKLSPGDSKSLWQSNTHTRRTLTILFENGSLVISRVKKRLLTYLCKNQISSTETFKLKLEMGTHGQRE